MQGAPARQSRHKLTWAHNPMQCSSAPEASLQQTVMACLLGHAAQQKALLNVLLWSAGDIISLLTRAACVLSATCGERRFQSSPLVHVSAGRPGLHPLQEAGRQPLCTGRF